MINIITRTDTTRLIQSLAILGISAGIVMLFDYMLSPTMPAPAPAPVVSSTTPQRTTFEHIVLEAESAYVLDVRHNTALFTKRPQQQQSLASLTKVMVALVAQSILPSDAAVTVTPAAARLSNGNGLRQNEVWAFGDILDITLLASLNEGAEAIAAAAGTTLMERATSTPFPTPQRAFVAAMNDQADLLGLEQTYFLNPTGLDTSQTVGGAYGSARDVAVLLAHVIKTNAALIDATRYREGIFNSRTIMHVATNTNHAVGDIPGLIGGKTGYTDLSGGNLAVAFDVGLNYPIVAVVLGSTEAGRFDDMRKLVAATYAHYNK